MPGVYPIEGGHQARVDAFLEALSDELNLSEVADDAVVAALLGLIVRCCLRAAAAEQDRMEPGTVPAATKRLAEQVLGVIDRRFSERLSLAEVAEHVACSRASVARAVRGVTGHTVIELIAERRMREARTLLADSDVPIGEIAARVGYPTPGYFHRLFRRVNGTTPQGWRASRLSRV